MWSYIGTKSKNINEIINGNKSIKSFLFENLLNTNENKITLNMIIFGFIVIILILFAIFIINSFKNKFKQILKDIENEENKKENNKKN